MYSFIDVHFRIAPDAGTLDLARGTMRWKQIRNAVVLVPYVPSSTAGCEDWYQITGCSCST